MTDEDSRFIKFRKSDIGAIRSFQETVMHDAAFGLLYRTGQAMGSRMARAARPYKQQYFEAVRRMLVDEGWCRDIQFVNETVTVSGSIETDKSARNTCHMLRGVVAKVYEGYFGKLMQCTEMECESCGKARCVLKVSFANNVQKKPGGPMNQQAGGQV